MDSLEQWCEWVGFIERQVTELCVYRHVYKETCEMLARNPETQKPSIFYSWMGGLFVTWSATVLGRLVDDRKDTRSFVRLLRSIKKSPHLLSRKHLVSLYVRKMSNFPQEEPARLANRKFDCLVGSVKESLPKKQVEKDIGELLDAAKPIVNFRHEHVAHLAANPAGQLPNYEQLDTAIESLVTLLQKYSLLITGVSADPFPTIVHDWQAIFRVPWIVSDK